MEMVMAFRSMAMLMMVMVPVLPVVVVVVSRWWMKLYA